MANEENLIPNSERTPSQRRANARKAGKASGEKRRQRKTMREMLDYLLSQDITDSKGNKKQTLEAVMVAQIREALKGNTKAIQFIRDTVGEMPITKQEITGSNFIQKVFVTQNEVKETNKHIDDVLNE